MPPHNTCVFHVGVRWLMVNTKIRACTKSVNVSASSEYRRWTLFKKKKREEVLVPISVFNIGSQIAPLWLRVGTGWLRGVYLIRFSKSMFCFYQSASRLLNNVTDRPGKRAHASATLCSNAIDLLNRWQNLPCFAKARQKPYAAHRSSA